MIKYYNSKVVYSKKGLYYQLYILSDSNSYYFDFKDEKQILEATLKLEDNEYSTIVDNDAIEELSAYHSIKEISDIFRSCYQSIIKIKTHLDFGQLNLIKPENEVYIINFDFDLKGLGFDIGFNSNTILQIDLHTLNFYSKKEDFASSLKYSIDNIKQVINGEINCYKMIINDLIILEEYIIVNKSKSKYFGFIDNIDVNKPEFIDEFDTLNMYYYLKLYLDLILSINKI